MPRTLERRGPQLTHPRTLGGLDRQRAARIKAGVGIVDEVATANGLDCYAAALGGADGRTLFLFANAADADPELRRNEPMGQVHACRVEAPAKNF
jgi:hypothetical protein